MTYPATFIYWIFDNSYVLIDGKWYRWLEGEKQEVPVADSLEELYEIYNQK